MAATMLIEPAVWRAASPSIVKIPAVGSRVYYFPQGHAEQASSAPDFAGVKLTKAFYLCVVSDNRYLADPDTDEVFLKISLVPVHGESTPPPRPEEDHFAAVTSFAKILTPSDANNGGGFSVPRFCAESVFPPLDFANNETPVQTIAIKDLLGLTWQFRHIYRGTPRRHLLTTGWSKFVNAKKLVAGDTIVFVKDGAGEIFVGIRRRLCRVLSFAPVPAADGNVGGFVRDGRGRVAPAAVAAAVGAAEAGTEFDVDFYPGPGRAEFVVPQGVVAAAMTVGPVQLVGGVRVRMPNETDDPSHIAWYVGTVSEVATQFAGPWAPSPWRMLQVIWDEPEGLPVAHLSPWQVEPISSPPPSTFHIDTPQFPVSKRLRLPQNPDLLNSEGDNTFAPMTTFRNMLAESMSQYSLVNPITIFPVGMQGARQGPTSAFTPYNPAYNSSTHHLSNDHPINVVVDTSTQNNLAERPSVNPTNSSTTSHAESPSPSSNDSILQHQDSNNADGSASAPPPVMLFGQHIHGQRPNDARADERDKRETEVARRSGDSSSERANGTDTSKSMTSNGGGSPEVDFLSIRR